MEIFSVIELQKPLFRFLHVLSTILKNAIVRVIFSVILLSKEFVIDNEGSMVNKRYY